MNSQLSSKKLANLKMLYFAANKLQDLCAKVVFLGGCTTAIFINNPAAPDVRYTVDVDCIIDVVTLQDYYKLETQLQQYGFKRDNHEGVICRWRYDDLILDIMPTDEKILGFSNIWYKPAIYNAVNYKLLEEIDINITTAPYFLATKFEAFKSRGNKDYFSSHDFEDIISVLDGRDKIFDEVMQSDINLKKYLLTSFKGMMNDESFHDALPGHLNQYGNLNSSRVEILTDKINQLIKNVLG